jgi:hypothetical protein
MEGNGTNDWVVWEGGVHKCTPQEWEKFFAPKQTQKNKFEMLKRLGAMMCMDKKDNNDQPIDMNLFGRDQNSPHRRIELILQPC